MQSEDSPGLIDTHCHLDLDPLAGQLPSILSAAFQAGVSRCVVPGVHPGGWPGITALAKRFASVSPAFGVHPMHSGLADDSCLAQLISIADKGVAIGEIGLDPVYAIPMDIQERAFRGQLRIAVSLGLPVLVHCRQAFQRTLRILTEERADQVGGIMHAYSGSAEMAREFIRLGFAISISGMVTRENTVRLPRLVSQLALEDLVLETDAPDLTPQRYRGQPNQPAYLVETLLAVARIQGVDTEVAARVCRANSLAILSRMPMS